MKTIVVVSQKGGVGKSTTAVTVGLGLAAQGLNTVIVDVDPQGHCAGLLGREQEPGIFNLLIGDYSLQDVIRGTGRARLSLVPGNKKTGTAHAVLMAEGRMGLDVFAGPFHPLERNGADVVILDTAPIVGSFQEAAIWMADAAIIPCAMDVLSAGSVAETVKTLRAINDRRRQMGREPCRILGILPTFFDATRESKSVLDELGSIYGTEIILPPIHRAVVFRECAAEGLTIWEKDPRGRAAQEYAELVWRVSDYAKA